MSDDNPFGGLRRPLPDSAGGAYRKSPRTSLLLPRLVLIVIGVVMTLGNVYRYMDIEGEVRELQRERPGWTVDERGKRVMRMVYAGRLFLGVGFVLLGVVVHVAPVTCTGVGLGLYLVLWAVFAIIDPLNLVLGLILNALFVLGLVKSVDIAVEYRRELKAGRKRAD